jgi:hypothetical protein
MVTSGMKIGSPGCQSCPSLSRRACLRPYTAPAGRGQILLLHGQDERHWTVDPSAFDIANRARVPDHNRYLKRQKRRVWWGA